MGFEELLVPLLVLGVPVAVLAAVGWRSERLRPLAVGLALAYLSFPIYYVLSRLPLDYTLRILLQVAAFAVIVSAVLLSISAGLRRRGYL